MIAEAQREARMTGDAARSHRRRAASADGETPAEDGERRSSRRRRRSPRRSSRSRQERSDA